MRWLDGSDACAALVLPVVIFLAEMCVVTLSTIRMICIARGRKVLAPVLGFFEITVWLFAIGQIMRNLSDPGCYIAFAAGFTLGNYLGIRLEKQLAIGSVVVRVISRKDVHDLIDALRAAAFGVTTIDAEGATGPVKLIFMVIQRRELGRVVALIKNFDSHTFYSVDELQAAEAGVFPPARRRAWLALPGSLRLFRQSA